MPTIAHFRPLEMLPLSEQVSHVEESAAFRTATIRRVLFARAGFVSRRVLRWI